VLPLHVKSRKLLQLKNCCHSLTPFHVKLALCNVQSLWFCLTKFQIDADKRTVMWRLVTCECQTGSVTLREEGRLGVFRERECVTPEKIANWGTLRFLIFTKHSSLNVTNVCLVEHVARMWEKRLRTGLWCETSRTEVTRKTKYRWDYNIKIDVKAVACGFPWVRIETSDGLLWNWLLTYRFHKMRGIICLSEELFASEERLFCWVNYLDTCQLPSQYGDRITGLRNAEVLKRMD
jgi:hypothetical protein